MPSGSAVSTSRACRTKVGATSIACILAPSRTSSRVFALGDVTLTRHRGTGFAVKLARNEQKRVLLYLTYRGPLPAWLGVAGKNKVVGVFRVT